jgi:hypothetical protein
LYNHLLSLLPWATDIAKELSLQIREAPDPRDVPGNKALLDRLNVINADMGLPEMPVLDPLKRGAGAGAACPYNRPPAPLA